MTTCGTRAGGDEVSARFAAGGHDAETFGASTGYPTGGFVLRAATNRPVAEYLEAKIWQEIGTEADATWLIDNSGQESTYMGLNAVLRDYTRLGLLLAHDGNWHGRQIIPAAWVVDATTVRPGQAHLWPSTATPVFGYG